MNRRGVLLTGGAGLAMVVAGCTNGAVEGPLSVESTDARHTDSGDIEVLADVTNHTDAPRSAHLLGEIDVKNGDRYVEIDPFDVAPEATETVGVVVEVPSSVSLSTDTVRYSAKIR